MPAFGHGRVSFLYRIGVGEDLKKPAQGFVHALALSYPEGLIRDLSGDKSLTPAGQPAAVCAAAQLSNHQLSCRPSPPAI